jgi:HEAT repeat protein
LKTRQIQLLFLIVFFLTVAASWFESVQSSTQENHSFKKLIDIRQSLVPRAVKKYRLPAGSRGQVISLLVSLAEPARLGAGDTMLVTLRGGKRTIASKSLHAGDPDLYTLFRLNGDAGEIEITSSASLPVDHTMTVLQWRAPAISAALAESEPNDSWKEANAFKLGQTVWASADDKPYILPFTETKQSGGAVPYQQSPDLTDERLPEGGIDWFQFTYDGEEPKLVHFELDLLERDNIPVDVSVFTVEKGEAKVYDRGADPVTPPHEVQALPGNKFTTRVITKGTYYLRVDANHVFYQLRTAVYDVPPYDDAARAVRAGMDYIISAGDSWHANTPRHGGLVNRVSSNHFETQLCIACHATHFSTRAELIANQNGYPVMKRSSLQFLTERLANNPLPFYGHPDAYWTRVISASANVMSRLASLVDQYDREFTGEKRLSLLKGVGGYLMIYYKGRTELPNDESNGNTPLVSTYEVAWYSWKVFSELFNATGEAEYREYRDQVRKLIEQEKVKNNIDLCYQTMAFATIDRAAYDERIKRNAERILSLQRPDGRWSMLFDADSPSVEFQTFHSLYVLALAGYGKDNPQVAKTLKLLLERQQEWGGWFDPKQSYENFGTPFRETQFAVMALSELYKKDSIKGWQTGATQRTGRSADSGPLVRLQQIDNIWDEPGQQVTDQVRANLESDEPLIRMSAAAALGRIGTKEALNPLIPLLGDRSKLVQIAAAQALRRIASKHQIGYTEMIAALSQPDERIRWGATRIFAQHFAYLSGNTAVADKLVDLLADTSVTVRMQAAKSLVQLFYWSKDESLRARIADAFISRMAVPEHPWMRRNLLEGFYSLADENVRYLYNNWIGHLPQKEDRDQAASGHHEASRRMAERIARALENGNELQRAGLLSGMTAFHLRSGGYTNAGRYTRIGNDVETIKFYEEGAPALGRALAPLVDSPDPAVRQQAVLATYTLRDNNLANLPLLVMRRLNDSDAAVRGVTGEFYRALPLKVVERNRSEAVKVLKELLASRYPEAQIAALDRIKALGRDFARREKFDDDVRGFVLRGSGEVDPKTGGAALLALLDFPELINEAEVQQRVVSALQSPDANLSRAASQLILLSPQLRGLPAIGAALDELLKTQSAAKQRMILDLINAETRVEDDLRIISLLTECLESPDEKVRSSALNAVRRVKKIQSNAAIRAGLVKLSKDPNQRLQGLAIAIYQGQDSGVALDLRAEEVLDYNFFVDRVMPLLSRKGADGNACINCHATHAIFKLVEPDKSGRFTDEQLRENYRSALKVVDLGSPENSLILRKPTSDSSVEGIAGAKSTAHGGGVRWQSANDPAYQTVLEWISGARMKTTTR